VQRTKNDCAIATVAMVANVDYEDIAKRSPAMIGSRGLFPPELHHMLVASTGVPWNRPRYDWLRPIAHFAMAALPLVAIIRRPWRWRTLHCIALQGGWFHDPEFPSGFRVEEYPRRHWRAVVVFVPESALRLLFVQHFRS
jgi:hypothetical protein